MSFMFCPVVSLCCTLRELQIILSLLHKKILVVSLTLNWLKTIYRIYLEVFPVVKYHCLADTLQYTPEDRCIIQTFAIWLLQI